MQEDDKKRRISDGTTHYTVHNGQIVTGHFNGKRSPGLMDIRPTEFVTLVKTPQGTREAHIRPLQRGFRERQMLGMLILPVDEMTIKTKKVRPSFWSNKLVPQEFITSFTVTFNGTQIKYFCEIPM